MTDTAAMQVAYDECLLALRQARQLLDRIANLHGSAMQGTDCDTLSTRKAVEKALRLAGDDLVADRNRDYWERRHENALRLIEPLVNALRLCQVRVFMHEGSENEAYEAARRVLAGLDSVCRLTFEPAVNSEKL